MIIKTTQDFQDLDLDHMMKWVLLVCIRYTVRGTDIFRAKTNSMLLTKYLLPQVLFGRLPDKKNHEFILLNQEPQTELHTQTKVFRH